MKGARRAITEKSSSSGDVVITGIDRDFRDGKSTKKEEFLALPEFSQTQIDAMRKAVSRVIRPINLNVQSLDLS